MTRTRILDLLVVTGGQGRDLDRALYAAYGTHDEQERARFLSAALIEGRQLHAALGGFLADLEAEAKAAAAQMQLEAA